MKKFMEFYIYVSFAIPCLVKALDTNGANVCTMLVSDIKSYQTRTSYTVQVSYQTCCAHFLFCWDPCKKSRNEVRYKTIIQTRSIYKTVHTCCRGYRQENDECRPICNPGCLHGRCIAPNKCGCYAGFTGNTCSNDINECDNHMCEQNCVNTFGSFVCRCQPGYIQSATNQYKCLNINECRKLSDLCTCADKDNNPECTAECVDTQGSYMCLCSQGYSLHNSRICTDEDECQTGFNECEQICWNTAGSYRCSCKQGFKLHGDGKNCTNINECATSNGGCEYTCQDTIGSYRCQCPSKMNLDENGKTCSYINQCLESAHGCQQRCENEKSEYRCDCHHGYRLNNDGKTCSDENECKTGNYACSDICVNTIGNYTCKCKDGFQLDDDGWNCKDIDECKNTETNPCSHICINTPGSYQCFCREGYQLKDDNHTCTGIPCQEMPPIHNGNATCLTGKTDDMCSFQCSKGFYLKGSEKRTCGKDHKWNGTTSSCDPRSCKTLEAPTHGSISLPCVNFYNSECEVSCIQGYFIDGSDEISVMKKCILNKFDNMVWGNDQVTCRKSEICFPNPCKHGGICTAEETINFSCDCHGTGYKGATCQVGFVEVPQIVVLSVNQEKQLKLFGKPENPLKIHISSISSSLHIEPKDLTLTSATNILTFNLNATSSGYFTLNYRLSGKNSAEFNTPQNSVVFVDGNYSSFGDPLQLPAKPDGSLKSECLGNDLDPTNMVLPSTMTRDNAQEPFNVFQVIDRFGNLIPLSFSGGIEKITNEYVETLNDGLNDATTTSIKEVIGTKKGCFFNHIPSQYIGPMVKSNTFLFTVQSLFNKNFPDWFQVYGRLFESEYEVSDLGGVLLKGTELNSKSSICTEGFTFDTNTIYYLYKTKRPLDILLPHKNITLSSAYIKCFIKNMNTSETRFVHAREKEEKSLGLENSISNEVTKLLRISGFTDRIGFTVNKDGDDIVQSYGKQRLSFEDIQESTSIKMIIQGRFYWNVGKFNNIFEKNFSKAFTITDGEIDVNINWFTLGNLQQIHIQGNLLSLKKYSVSKEYVQTQTSISVKNIEVSKVLSNIFTLKTGEIVQLNIKTADLLSPISLDKDTKENIRKITLLNTGAIHNITNFLRKYEVNSIYRKYTFNETTQLLEIFSKIISLSRQLNNELKETTTTTKQIVATFTVLRNLYLDARKRFQTLFDAHQRSKLSNEVEVRKEFQNFDIVVNELMKITFDFNFSGSSNVSLTIQSFELIGKGQACINTICLKNQPLTIQYFPLFQDSRKKTTYLKVSIIDGIWLGGIINIPSHPFNIPSNIWITFSKTSENYTGYVNGITQFFKQNISIRATLERNQMSFQENVKFLDDDVSLKATGSLRSAIYAGDPILLMLEVEKVGPSKIIQSIKTSIASQISEKLKNLRKRHTINQKTLDWFKNDLSNISIKMHSLRKNHDLSQQYIEELKQNISKMKKKVQRTKQKLSQLIKHETETTRSLFNECEPRVCSLTCIPGLIIIPCQKNLTKHTFEQKCVLKEVEGQTFKMVRVTKQKFYREFDAKSTCKRKCTGLIGLAKGKKRKRRGVATVVMKTVGKVVLGAVADKVTEVLEIYGGPYAKIGGMIGDAMGGPIGQIVGAAIGVGIKYAIGGCNTECTTVYIPKLVPILTSKIERRPSTYKKNESLCHNKQKIINIGYGVMEECIEFSNCSDFIADSQCVQRNEKCAEFEDEIKLATNSQEVNSNIMEHKKYSVTLNFLEKSLQEKENRHKTLQQRLQMDSALMKRIENSIQETKASFQKINGLINIWNDLERKRNILQSIPFTYNFSIEYTSGMKFPNRIAVDFRGFRVSTTSLFDINNHKGSAYEAARKILMALKLLDNNAINRKKRSINQQVETSTPSQLEEKCTTMKKAILFSMNILENIKETIVRYKNQTTEFQDTIKYISMEKQNLFQNIAMESHKIINDDSEFAMVDDFISIIGKEDTQNNLRSWNETLKNALLEFHNTSLSEECFSLADCISYHFEEVGNTIKFENNSQSVSSLFESLRVSLLTLVESYPEVSLAEKVIDETIDSMKMINPMEMFCGEEPLIKIQLTGQIHLKEHEILTISMEVGESPHEVEFQWKVNNTIIRDEYNAILKRKVTKKDSGYYSCQATNKFGTSYCGSVEVIVYKKPVFLEQPTAAETYINSPTPIYLYCNVTEMDEETQYIWYFQSFHNLNATEEIPYANQTFLLVPNHSEELSGYYFCTVKTRMYTVESKKAPVSILSASVPIEKFKITMTLSEVSKKSYPRARRSIEEDLLKTIADSMLLDISEVHHLENDVSDEGNNTLSFVLEGKNFTEELYNGSSWENVSGNKINDRNNMLLRSVLLYEAAQENSFSVEIDNIEYDILPDSIQAEPLEVVCPIGQVVLDNGFMCGDCPAGSRYDEEEFECRPCQKDSYQPATKQTSCISCPDGFVTQSDGSVTILECVKEVNATNDLEIFNDEYAEAKQYESGKIIGIVVAIVIIVISAIIIVALLVVYKKKNNRIETVKTYMTENEELEVPTPHPITNAAYESENSTPFPTLPDDLLSVTMMGLPMQNLKESSLPELQEKQPAAAQQFSQECQLSPPLSSKQHYQHTESPSEETGKGFSNSLGIDNTSLRKPSTIHENCDDENTNISQNEIFVPKITKPDPIEQENPSNHHKFLPMIPETPLRPNSLLEPDDEQTQTSPKQLQFLSDPQQHPLAPEQQLITSTHRLQLGDAKGNDPQTVEQ